MKHKAYVDVTLKVEVLENWGKDCSLEQVRNRP